MLKKINILLVMFAVLGLAVGFVGCAKEETASEEGTEIIEAEGGCCDGEDESCCMDEESDDDSEASHEEESEETEGHKDAAEGDDEHAAKEEPVVEEAPVAEGMELFKPEIPSSSIKGTPTNSKVENLDKTPPKAPEFLAPAGTTNLAFEKIVTASDEFCSVGEIDMITDGDKRSNDETYIEMAPKLQWIQIDLEKECEIYAILAWHYLTQPRVYNDVIVQVSNDEDFIDATTLFNNDHDNSASELGLGKGDSMNYYDTNKGKLIDGKGTKARYIRLYSNGNNNSNFNHYVEVEVYGI